MRQFKPEKLKENSELVAHVTEYDCAAEEIRSYWVDLK